MAGISPISMEDMRRDRIWHDHVRNSPSPAYLRGKTVVLPIPLLLHRDTLPVLAASLEMKAGQGLWARGRQDALFRYSDYYSRFRCRYHCRSSCRYFRYHCRRNCYRLNYCHCRSRFRRHYRSRRNFRQGTSCLRELQARCRFYWYRCCRGWYSGRYHCRQMPLRRVCPTYR